jgi:alpha-tubulin suppressor-like RCC1 family protein
VIYYMNIFTKINRLVAIILFTSSIFIASIVHADSNTEVVIAKGWAGISTGYTHSLGIKEDGSVWQWGDKFGEGKNIRTKLISPTQVEGLTNMVAVAAGGEHSLALKEDGTVWAWGENSTGQLGDGTRSEYSFELKEYTVKNDRISPVQVKGLSNVAVIRAGFTHSFAIKKDGTVWVWGNVAHKEIQQFLNYTILPSQLKGLSDVVWIDRILEGYLVLKKDGSLWTLGMFDDTPVLDTNVSGIKQVAFGNGNTFFLKFDGTVMATGENSKGELGDGTYIDREDIVTIEGIQDVQYVAASAGGPLYLKNDGTLWTNGYNGGGQLGIGSYKNVNAPVQIKGISNVSQISASEMGYRVMALKDNHTLWSWGNGYVGDGTKWYRTVPTMIRSYDTVTLQDIGTVKVDVNGKELVFDQPPVIINKRTMVPLRKIFESMGAAIAWDPVTSTVTAIKEQTVVKLTIGSKVGYVNEEAVSLDDAAVVVNGNTLVPIRFIGTAFGADVVWDENTRTVYIKSGQ